MKKILLLLLIYCGAALLAGCNDFLDTSPDNRTEIDSEEKFASLIAGSYPRANYAALLNSRVDYVTDKVTGSEHSSNSDSFYWTEVNSTSTDSPNYIWEKYYFSIAQVNHGLVKVGKIGINDKTKPYIAEAKIVRAFSHFLLVNLFADFWEYGGTNSKPGIPYVTQPEEEVIKQYDRETVAVTYEKIEKDLLEGLKDLGNDNVYKVPRYHFTRAAANAFAARFYLYKGEWAKVIDHATKVLPVPSTFINEQRGDLIYEGTTLETNTMLSRNVNVDDRANVYAASNFQPWISKYSSVSGGSTEIKQLHSSADNTSVLLFTEMASNLSRYANSWRYGCTKPDTDATVSSANVTTGVWSYRVYSSGVNYYVPKFHELFVRQSINATTGVVYTMYSFLRNEEVLINRAEAYAMLGMYDEAIDDLNVFCRQRVYVNSSNNRNYDEVKFIITKLRLLTEYAKSVSNEAHYMNTYNAFGSKDWPLLKKCLIQCILDFRRNEFMWEGLRYWDMWRYKIPVVHYADGNKLLELLPGDDRWLIEIPETATLSGVALNPRQGK